MKRGRLWTILGPYLLLLVVGGGAAGIALLQLGRLATREPISWRYPAFGLLGLVSLLLVWGLFHRRGRRQATLRFSRVSELRRTRIGWVGRLSVLPAVLRISAMSLLAAALARPQTYKTENLEVEGIDIMIVMDLSRSMEERDIPRTRLDAGQRTIRRFLRNRTNDRIGLVVFAREAMLRSPLTLDYGALDEIVSNLRIGDVPEMGTAVGDALGLALASLRRSDAASKVVVLLSDGESNISMEMDPGEAKRASMLMGVRVFTILMGRAADAAGGTTRGPANKQYAVNPELLQQIARETGGLFFGAADGEALETAFAQVRATLDKSRRRIAGKLPDRELFHWFAVPALVLLLLELLMAMTRWRRFP